MSCPSCGGALAAGHGRCPACGAVVAPPVEGALAPEPTSATPPARPKGPLRDIPGLRRKEPTWKEEVRERVRRRKRREPPETAAELPLFPASPSDSVPPDPPAAPERPEAEPEPEPQAEAPGPTAERPEAVTALGSEPPRLATEEPMLEEEPDLPLRPLDATALSAQVAEAAARAPEPNEEEAPAEEAWELGTEPSAGQQETLPPPERPAFALERVQAALADLALLVALWAVVVYFASRAARVPVEGLLPAWPYLAIYLAFLGLAYAAYFTGTTGQTLGKMALGLRVVDTAGRPPGWARALVRAAAGSLGLVLAGVGALPLFFDPARRALHDRLLNTRVVKS